MSAEEAVGGYRAELRYSLRIAVAVFISEAAVMMILLFLPVESEAAKIFLDSSLLLLILAPAIYLFVYLPLRREISFRTRTQAELDATSLLRALFQASPLAIIALDPEGRVTIWNLAAERMFGWSEEDAVGGFNPIVPEDKRDEFRALGSGRRRSRSAPSGWVEVTRGRPLRSVRPLSSIT